MGHRRTSRRYWNHALVYAQNGSETVQSVIDVVTSKCMPEHGRIYSCDWFPEPTLGFISETRNDKIGSHIYDRLASRFEHFPQGGAYSRPVDHRDCKGCFAVNAMQLGNRVSGFGKVTNIMLIKHCGMRRQNTNPLYSVFADCLGRCLRCSCSGHSSQLFQALFETLATSDAAHE
jgi:hypothetical protein